MTIDLESWQAIAGAVGLIIIGIHGKWEVYRTRKRAEKAVELSRPTGNGFATEVRQALARIEMRQERDGDLLYDHIKSHANADILKGAQRELTSNQDAP